MGDSEWRSLLVDMRALLECDHFLDQPCIRNKTDAFIPIVEAMPIDQVKTVTTHLQEVCLVHDEWQDVQACANGYLGGSDVTP